MLVKRDNLMVIGPMRNSLLSVFVALMVVSMPTLADAATTEWFKGKDKSKVISLLKGKLLLAIECRDGQKIGLNLNKDEFRLTYADNPTKKRYLWAVGSAFGPYKARAKRENYKLVNLSQYTRKSGLKIRCAVWHKD